MKILAGTEYRAKDKIVSKMTREGFTEENIREGSVKEISQRSRGHPAERQKSFVIRNPYLKKVWRDISLLFRISRKKSG